MKAAHAAAGVMGLVLLASCYTLGAPMPRHQRVFVEVVDGDGIDVDLAALLATATRDAVAGRAELSLVGRGDADVTLRVDLVPGAAGLSALADPARRAAEYRVEVRLQATLVTETSSRSEPLWRSDTIVGEATYLSAAGSIVALDGARRRALARAAEDAAQRLVTALVYAR